MNKWRYLLINIFNILLIKKYNDLNIYDNIYIYDVLYIYIHYTIGSLNTNLFGVKNDASQYNILYYTG